MIASASERARAVLGFTLIELMMVLVILAVLLGVAAPAFQDTLRRSRMQSAFNDTAAMLAFARAEAVARGAPVTACASADGSACGGTAFEAGWLVFADDGVGASATARNGILEGSEEILRIGGASSSEITVRSVNFPAATHVIFLDSGRLDQGLRGTFIVCDARGADEARGLVVNVSGQARFAIDGDADGIPEDDSGSALSCP